MPEAARAPRENPEHRRFGVLFKPADYGVTVPPRASVYVRSDAAGWAVLPLVKMRREGANFHLPANLPKDAKYKFFVIPEGKTEAEGFYVPAPAGDKDTNALTFTPPADGDPGIDAATPRIPTARETPGATVMRVARKKIEGVYAAAEAVNEEDEASVTTLYKTINEVRRYVLNKLEEGEKDQGIRGFLKADFAALIKEAHKKSLDKRTDLGKAQKESLATPKGRIEFRAKTYNAMCEESILGLSPRKKLRPSELRRFTTNELAFAEVLKKRMKKNYPMFDGVCSNYDGSTVLRTLTGFAKDVENSRAIEDATMTEKELKEERTRLEAASQKRIEKEMGKNYKLKVERDNWAKALEGGGAVALKAAAIGLIWGSGWGWVTGPAALGLWAGRGISNAMGKDFGMLLKNSLIRSARAAKKGFKAGTGEALELISEETRGKIIPDAVEKLAESAEDIDAPLESDELKLSLKERLKLVGRDVFTVVPPIFEKIPYIGALIPSDARDEGSEHAEAVSTKNHEAKNKIDEICKEVLSIKTPAAPQREAAAQGGVNPIRPRASSRTRTRAEPPPPPPIEDHDDDLDEEDDYTRTD